MYLKIISLPFFSNLSLFYVLFFGLYIYIYIYCEGIIRIDVFSFVPSVNQTAIKFQTPSIRMNGNLNSNRARRHSPRGTELGRGGEEEKEERKEITWHSARQIYVHLSPGDHNLRQQDQTPRETTRETWDRGNRTTRRAKRPTPTTRLVSCFSSSFGVRERGTLRNPFYHGQM